MLLLLLLFVEKEQEELLMYLADLDIKVRRYKTRLEEIGQEVSSSGEESDNETIGTNPNELDLLPQADTYINGFHGNLEYVDDSSERYIDNRLVPATATHLFTPIGDMYSSHSVPPNLF